jgi:hypothetical protein
MALFVGDPSAPTRFGTDVANTADETGLFLKIAGGEVFAAFSETTLMLDKHYVREIQSGKSAQFPKTWKVSAAYHTAGQEMLGQDTSETERVISIDGLLVSHIGIYDLDEVMSHFDIRSRYTDELGKALARVLDENVMRAIILTARDSSTLGGGSNTTSPFPSGQVITSSAASVTLAATGAGDDWWKALRFMRTSAGADNVPDSEPLWVVVPYNTFDSIQYAQVGDTASNPFIFRDTRNNMGPQGGLGVNASVTIDGITVLRSNLIPTSNDVANSDIKAKYRANYTGVLGLGWGRDGVGTVKLIGMGLEQTRDVRRQEDFIVAKMAVGHGALRNELTWEFRDV